MKILYYLLFVCCIQAGFSQEKKEGIFLGENFLNIDNLIEKNDQIDLPKWGMLETYVFTVRITPEGKFLVDKKNSAYFNKQVQGEVLNEDKNFAVDTNKELVNQIIVEKLREELKIISNLNAALSYGDRNIDLYRNYSALMNQLIITKNISKNTTVQIGKSVYPYLNKILKSELDQTLQNSINLLAINFK